MTQAKESESPQGAIIDSEGRTSRFRCDDEVHPPVMAVRSSEPFAQSRARWYCTGQSTSWPSARAARSSQ